MTLSDLLLLARLGVMHPHPLVRNRARYERFAVYRVEGSGRRGVIEGVGEVRESTVDASVVIEEHEGRESGRSSRFERDEGHVVAGGDGEEFSVVRFFH